METSLEILRLQKENIELKGMILGNQLREINAQIAALENQPAVGATP